MPTVDSLYNAPNALWGDYSRFRVSERMLLTGHSHQAWPDCGFEGQEQAWRDAAEHVDAKWERAFERAARVRAGFAALLDTDASEIALATNTHELVSRLLSALPLRSRPRIVTTDGEFHTVRRQVDRLAEARWIELDRVPWSPVDTLAGRVAGRVDERTAIVMVSAVSFMNGEIVDGLADVARACEAHGAELLVDAYHALGALPFPVPGSGLEKAFVVGGGYKYLQLGEGNCFIRVPPGCELRPVYTGWYAEFETLSDAGPGGVGFGEGASRFIGATYDPTSHYRAAEVFAFFQRRGLTPSLLRDVSRHQVGLLASRFDDLDADPGLIRRERSVPLERIGGFLVLRTPRAPEMQAALLERGVRTDYRGDALRLGPAPYLSDDQLHGAMDALAGVVRGFA